MKKLIVVALLMLAGAASAQSSQSKKDLVAKVLQLQQVGIEQVAGNIVMQPTQLMMARAGQILQSRIPPDQRAAVAKDIQGDLKKYADQTVPPVRARAVELAPSTIGVLLDERFTEDELKQLIAIIESPVNRKFTQMNGEMLKSLAEKLVPEFQTKIEANIRTLDRSVVGRLGIQPPAAAASK
jgi:uncharacterized protein